MRGHAIEFGSHELAVHDRIAESLAVGCVLATVVWLTSLGGFPPTLEDLEVRYGGAEAFNGDADIQHVRLGPALRGKTVTCLDLAIYEAARHQVLGSEAWVEVIRGSERSPAHAIVALATTPRQFLDPSSRIRGL